MGKENEIKEAARTKSSYLWWWLFGKAEPTGKTTKSVTRPALRQSGSFIRWLFTKSPRLLRKGIWGVVIYGLSRAAKSTLDAAHEQWPNNKFIGKADAIARAAVKVEDFLIEGTTAVAKDIYEAIPEAKAGQPNLPVETVADSSSIIPTPDQLQAKLEPMDLTEAGVEIPKINEADLTPVALTPSKPHARSLPDLSQPPAIIPALREAAFLPAEPNQRYRGNLNSMISTQVQPEPDASTVAPDGLPMDGGLDPATGITWGPYKKSVRQEIENKKPMANLEWTP